MQRQVIAKNAAAGYKTALKIEQQAKEAGISLDKDTMRRLEKITSRYIEAAKKAEFQSDQAHKMRQQKAEAFRSGTTAAAKKQRKEDYRTGGWGK